LVKYKGIDLEVRVATTEEGLATADPVPYIDHVEWDSDQSIDRSPKGHGFRTQEAREGLLAIGGNIVRSYDPTEVADDMSWFDFWEADSQEALTPRYVQIKNKLNGRLVTLKKVIGSLSESSDTDGFLTQSLDFVAEEVEETPPA